MMNIWAMRAHLYEHAFSVSVVALYLLVVWPSVKGHGG